MKVLLDENVARPLSDVLKSFLERKGHRIDHVHDLDWSGTKDVELYQRATAEGYHVILTSDEKQLKRAPEVAVIAASGIHRIQYSHPSRGGLVGIGVAIGTVTAGLAVALDELAEAPSQLLIKLRGIDPSRSSRILVTDPAQDPPPHWPARAVAAVPAQAGEPAPEVVEISHHVPHQA
ncbi:DUF5615 family PIN-like protein [Catellatospora bangladeshensis]|uniref:VapC45 PIN like domain-containing protein n=1 Tax=Catellatospora bangladeshensis TaxID=310355 RepID=A0A8J3JMC1_9ACTN|nr:DUF5615 family PIN-like protein [Catellatospora bangladeshensis]GIF81318.1 hypothetical protein Cba03nite_26670 [Catellatospora bangladeshensis]